MGKMFARAALSAALACAACGGAGDGTVDPCAPIPATTACIGVHLRGPSTIRFDMVSVGSIPDGPVSGHDGPDMPVATLPAAVAVVPDMTGTYFLTADLYLNGDAGLAYVAHGETASMISIAGGQHVPVAIDVDTITPDDGGM